MQCELCGQGTELVKARIEGVELDVCPACALFGTVIRKAAPMMHQGHQAAHQHHAASTESGERLITGFAETVRKQRGKLGLTQEAFARMLAERESVVQKMESGTYVPSLEVARKMERILKIKLIEQEKEEAIIMPQASSSAYTLGDFLKKR